VDGHVVLDIVNHLHDDTVAFPGDDLGAGELAVHRWDGAGGAQPCHVLQCNLPMQSHTGDETHYVMS
jgi:hypothetical protein